MLDKATKEIFTQALEDPTASVELYAGMKDVTKPGDTDASYEPDGSKTFVLKIKGGANNVEITRVKLDGDDRE